MTNITFRPATPDDVHIAVPLIYASGPAAFEYVFKVSDQKAAQNFLSYVFTRRGSEFSYDNHTCMVDDHDQVVGIGAAFGSEVAGGFTLAAVRYIFGFYGLWDGVKVIRRGLAIEQIISPPKGPTESLVHLSIKPECRGRGLGSQLVQHFLEQAKDKGRATASLDVSIENPRAMSLYQRLGFEITSENPSKLKNEFSYVADHYKMHRQV